jgi:ER-bound oxygenase mpaB/B'/Rubber oxygenase, catalytic domain
MRRSGCLADIEGLDPERAYERIYKLCTDIDFAWDTRRALEVALLSTFAVPSVSRVVDGTGEFVERGQKRYDDMVLLLREAAADGYDSSRGRAAISRINAIHAAHRIPNVDYLFVLSTFVVVPVRWNARYGWRLYGEHEIRATVNTYRHLGHLMGIKKVPQSYAEFERCFDRCVERRYTYDPANQRLALGTLAIFESWWRAPLRWFCRQAVLAVLDDSLREALGLPAARAPMRMLVDRALRARATALRIAPRRFGARKRRRPVRSYPRGYELTDLGPWPSTTGARCPLHAVHRAGSGGSRRDVSPVPFSSRSLRSR